MLRLAYPLFATGRPALGLLVLRVVFGVAIALHGWPKIQDPFHWMDRRPDAAPELLQLLAALSELAGGIALALGLLTPLACLGILATLGYAIYLHVAAGDPFVEPGVKTWELAGLHVTASLALLFAGPGRWSLDFFLFGRRRGEQPPI